MALSLGTYRYRYLCIQYNGTCPRDSAVGTHRCRYLYNGTCPRDSAIHTLSLGLNSTHLVPGTLQHTSCPRDSAIHILSLGLSCTQHVPGVGTVGTHIVPETLLFTSCPWEFAQTSGPWWDLLCCRYTLCPKGEHCILNMVSFSAPPACCASPPGPPPPPPLPQAPPPPALSSPQLAGCL